VENDILVAYQSAAFSFFSFFFFTKPRFRRLCFVYFLFSIVAKPDAAIFAAAAVCPSLHARETVVKQRVANCTT